MKDVQADIEQSSTSDEQTVPLTLWERLAAFVAGGGLAVCGAFAVFESMNQAGTAALLIGAAAFLLMAVQGTPLLSVGNGTNRLDFDRRRRRLDRALEQAIQDDNLDVAKGMVAATKILEPAFASGSPAVKSLRYEERVRDALEELGAVDMPGAEAPIDMIINRHGRGLPIIVKYRASGPLSVNEVHAQEEQARRVGYSGPILIVTNARLTRQVEEFNAERAGKPTSVEVVTWNDERDNDLLSRAIGRGAR